MVTLTPSKLPTLLSSPCECACLDIEWGKDDSCPKYSVYSHNAYLNEKLNDYQWPQGYQVKARNGRNAKDGSKLQETLFFYILNTFHI